MASRCCNTLPQAAMMVLARRMNVSSEQDLTTEVEPAITFSLVEEGKYSPFKLVKHLKRLMLTGDIAGLRAFRDIKSNCLVNLHYEAVANFVRLFTF